MPQSYDLTPREVQAFFSCSIAQRVGAAAEAGGVAGGVEAREVDRVVAVASQVCFCAPVRPSSSHAEVRGACHAVAGVLPFVNVAAEVCDSQTRAAAGQLAHAEA